MSNPAIASSPLGFLQAHCGFQLNPDGRISHFADPERELTAFSEAGSAALVTRPEISTFIHQGPDALDLLHRLSTNDLLALEPGQNRFTVLTSEKGRVVDLLNVSVLGTDRLLLWSETTKPQPVIDWIDRFTIIEDAELSDVSESLLRLALIGSSAYRMANTAFGVELEPNHTATLSGELDGTFIAASRWGSAERIDIAVPLERTELAWTMLTTTGATPAGDVAYQAARVIAGIPAVGLELDGKANPLEAGLKDLISFTKGCYVGQEVVARLDTYDKLQKQLVKLTGSSPLVEGAELTASGKRAGVVTSVSDLAGQQNFNALGFARRGHWDEGTILECDGETVTVSALPVIPPFA